MNQGLVLFAHGARDPHWALPFERLLNVVRSMRPGLRVKLAFLELMQPDLLTAVSALVAEQCSSIRIVPVFLGEGGHVREDLPSLVDRLRREHPAASFTVLPANGEQEAVLHAIASVCVADL